MGITQPRLATQYGVSERTVRNWIKSEWYELARQELASGGLLAMVAEARASLSLSLTSENEQVRLAACKFALERLDPAFAKRKDDEKKAENSKGGLKAASDAEIAALRERMNARKGTNSPEQNAHADFHHSFADNEAQTP